MISLEQVCMKYDRIIILASNDVREFLRTLNNIGIDAIAIDYDPKFENTMSYVNKDFVFDDVDLTADLIIHKNVEKTYPVELPEGTDVILIGDNDQHNGDCTPIESCEQLISLYDVGEIYDQGCDEDETHWYVYGKIRCR